MTLALSSLAGFTAHARVEGEAIGLGHLSLAKS
jgi:hypothetical protein